VSQFVGSKIIEMLNGQKVESKEQLAKLFPIGAEVGVGNWVDMVGLLAPATEVDGLLNQMVNGELKLPEIQQKLDDLHANYAKYAWNWTRNLLEKLYTKPFARFEAQDIVSIIEKWKKAVLTFDDLILRDAKKEFNAISRTGFGIDGTEEEKQLDFDAVRGTYDENSFVKDINNQINTTTELADRLLLKLSDF